MNLVEEIKSNLSLMGLIHRLGIEVYRYNFIFSIYKEETKPSLKLNPDKNYYYCFSTGKGGDVIDFYADYYHITKKEAIHELAEMLGIERELKKWNLRKDVISKQKNVKKTKRIKVLKIEKELFEERAGIYMEIMDKGNAETNAFNDIINKRIEIQNLIYESLEKYCFGLDEESLDYLLGEKRGLLPGTIKKFRIFSIKNVLNAIEYLKECFSNDELLLSGLFNEKGKFIFAKHRLIIPYIENNKIIYLRGRIVKSAENNPKTQQEAISKYIGLYNFSTNLTSKRFFNTDTIKNLKKDDSLLICEGEFDTMIVDQCGLNSIGIPGVTNFPQKEVELIKDLDIYLLFDNDEAGIKAMIEKAKLFNKPIKGIKLKNYKDITEYVNGIRRRKFSR